MIKFLISNFFSKYSNYSLRDERSISRILIWKIQIRDWNEISFKKDDFTWKKKKQVNEGAIIPSRIFE